jgi:RNA polymerase sigma-70 factor (ECF subfamily)
MTAKEFQYKLINLRENLMRFAYSLTADKDDAKDLVQETFLKALKYCDKFVHEANLKAWTYTIMKNTFINDYRRVKRYNIYNNQTKEGFYLNYIHASNADVPDSVYTSKELEKIIEALDEDYKLPFKMHNEGFKYKEIAETLDLNLGTVKSRIFFARKNLMKQLNG